MKFALVNGQKTEATKGAKGVCAGCGSDLVAKCGEIKTNHWAHKKNRNCDRWGENETEWHRAWKGQFPIDWQEVVHRDKNGEKHVADVKTNQGWGLDFQHSYLKPEERRVRDAFYQRLVWVVDGARRKRDKPQFFKALKHVARVNENPLILRVPSGECALLQEWAGCHAPVHFDFGEDNKPEGDRIWCLLPGSSNGWAYVAVVTRSEFIRLHRTGSKKESLDFAEILKKLCEIVTVDIALRQRAQRRAQKQYQLALQVQNYRLRRSRRKRRPQSFPQYLARKRRPRLF